jgi:hypothetical protein
MTGSVPRLYVTSNGAAAQNGAGKAPLAWLRAGRGAGDVPAGQPRKTRTNRAHKTT